MTENFDFEYMKYCYGKDHLSDIFKTAIDTFQDVSSPKVDGQVNLYELLLKIKYNFGTGIETLLTPKYLNGERNAVYDKLKVLQNAVCYNANFDGYKDLKHIKTKTNLMFLDIDDFETRQEAENYKKDITLRYDWIVACCLSLSRLGLHVIIQADKIHCNDDFNSKYDFISAKYFESRLDKNGKSLTRYTVIPCDYNIYINESPSVLNIDEIIKENEKGILSVYKKEEIISTAYTFSDNSPLKEILNDSARNGKLKFKQDADESLFTDPDIPLYVPEGIDVIDINLFPYRHKKVKAGNRTSTIGALIVQMIYLNAESPEYNNTAIKESILKYILSVNKAICDPPLQYKEVLNSFNANWIKYEAGELDVSKFSKKKHAFWSKNTTLKGNDKRKITCRIKNEPKVKETKQKIRDAIEAIQSNGVKLTQKKVAEISGLELPTIKKYRKYYKELVNVSKMTTTALTAIPAISETVTSTHNKFKNNELTHEEYIIDPYFDCIDISSTNSINDFNIKNQAIASFEQESTVEKIEPKEVLSEEEKLSIFQQFFKSILDKLSEHQVQELKTRFVNLFNTLSNEDAILMKVPINEVDDSKFWYKAMLEDKFRGLCKGIVPNIIRQ